jgi:hypothetical protein
MYAETSNPDPPFPEFVVVDGLGAAIAVNEKLRPRAKAATVAINLENFFTGMSSFLRMCGCMK